MELLFVILIVSVVAALILAGSQKIRKLASRTTDVSRIKQLATACNSFAAESGHYPDSIQAGRETWDIQLFPELGLQATNASPSTGLLNYNGAGLEVFAASWDKAPRKAGGLPRGFALAGWICNAIQGQGNQPGPYTSAWGVNWDYFHGAPLTAIRRPAEYVLITPIGRSFQNPANVIGAGSYALSDWPGDDPAMWPYDGSAPFALCDGSVTLLRRSEFSGVSDFRKKYADNSPR